MRLIPIFLLAVAGSLSAGEGPAKPAYPLWDGSESVEQYAKKVNLPPTKSLDLGNGVKLELVLIPAGRFMMGTPEPVPVDEDGFQKKIITGQVLLAVSIVSLLVMLMVIVVQAIRKRQRPKFSLLWLLAMTAVAGVAVLSYVHWRQTERELNTSRLEYDAAQRRYEFSNPDAENPAHSVTLTQAIYMGKFVVTQEQWQQIWGYNPSTNRDHKNNPVEHVSWNDTQEYCRRLHEQLKEPVRLPTEAEWEFACRAGTSTNYYSGDTEADLNRVGWYRGNAFNTTHPVGQKEPNAFGLYDMHGNVFQWCQDSYYIDYYQESESENPHGPTERTCRVLRGGSFEPFACRSAYRYRERSGYRSYNIGLRVVVEPSFKSP